MGEVLLAWDDRLKRRVAIKRIRQDHGGLDSVLRQRLLREARASAGLCHPAVVQVYDLIEDSTGDCIVLEYVEGRTLAASLAESGPLEPAHATRLAREIADGLAAAHAAGIVHRDLKPENVVITLEGHAKILDFGLARILSPAADDAFVTQHGMLLGTFHMMSPEQASGDETDERSDLFSLGALLYEMLTGRSPFRGANPAETLNRVFSENPPRVDAVRPGVPSRLGDLVERLLAKEPEDRPGDAAEVVRELEAIVASLSSSATPTLTVKPEDLPTVVDVPRLAVSRLVPPEPSSPVAGQSITDSPGRRTAATWFLATLILGVTLCLVGRILVRWGEASSTPLRVLVLWPQGDGGDRPPPLSVSAVRYTTLSTLGSLEGVTAIDPTKLLGAPATPKEMTRFTAANEILVIDLDKVGDQIRVKLTRESPTGRSSRIKTIHAPIGDDHVFDLAKAVDERLQTIYEERHVRPETPSLNARTEDFAAYIAVRQRLDAGAVPSQEDMNRLQNIVNESYEFLDARLFAAGVSLSRYSSTQDPEDLHRAEGLIAGALKSAPDAPRPLITQFRIDLARGETATAEKRLNKLKNLLNADPQIFVLQSELAEHKGNIKGALNAMKRAIDSASAWQDLYRLADLEARNDNIEAARHDLQQILGTLPDNVFVRDRLARIELLYGDPQKAEQQYEKLVQVPNPHPAHYVNLGSARMLQGHYKDAAIGFEQALAISLDSANKADIHLNLAEAELARGRRSRADEIFRQTLKEYQKSSGTENLLAQAECLAFLGKKREAVRITRDELQRRGGEPDALRSAALIYAQVGDRIAAMDYVDQALQKRVHPYWFLRMPGYESLRADPEFRDLLNKRPEAPHRASGPNGNQVKSSWQK